MAYASSTLKYDFYSSFLNSFDVQREFVGNIVRPDIRAVAYSKTGRMTAT